MREPFFRRGYSMPVTDVAAFVGSYPFRHIEHGSTEWVLTQMDRLGIDRAWVGHLPSFLYKDPAPGNRVLEALTKPHADRLSPVPTIDPAQSDWNGDLNFAVAIGAPAVRLYPQYQGIDAVGGEMRVVLAALAAAGIPVILTVRFEDARQRHPLDSAAELSGALVRALARSDPDLRILVTHADRAIVEEVHFGLTPQEARRVLWEISWIWGPPEDHLALLLEAVGTRRFTLGTGMPLRTPDAVFAKLDLLENADAMRSAIGGENLERWLNSSGQRSAVSDQR